MKLVIASDHAGFELKTQIKEFLKEKYHGKIKVVDFGAHKLEEGDDYTDYVSKASQEVSKDPKHVIGIVIGGSGQGEAIVSNRYKGVRATVYYGGSIKIVELGREHNNSNVLSLGARFISKKEALKAVEKWLLTPFSEDERHIRRNKKIDTLPFSFHPHHN